MKTIGYIALLQLILSGVPSAFADLMSYRIEGTISQVSANLSPFFAFGLPYVLEFTYDTAALDSDPSTELGVYDSAITYFMLDYNSATYSGIASQGTIRVTDNAPVPPADIFQAYVSSDNPGTFHDIGIYRYSVASVVLRDTTSAVFGDDQMPAVLNVGDYDSPEVFMSFVSGSGTEITLDIVRGNIGSMAVIPEPSSVLLLALGVLLLSVNRITRRMPNKTLAAYGLSVTPFAGQKSRRNCADAEA